MKPGRVVLTKHALRRMQERHISFADVSAIIEQADIVETRDEFGQKVYVLLGYAEGRALHVVVAQYPDQDVCHVRTAYDPDPNEWSAGFRRRK
jgi:uncharacterized DUF497 family protein